MKYLLFFLTAFALSAHATQTIMAEGARNVVTGCLVATGGGTGTSYGGATADPSGVADSTQAFLDALNINRHMSATGGAIADPVTIYVPSGTYKVTSLLNVWDNTLFYGEPSSRPTITLVSGSMTSGSNPFVVSTPSEGHAAYSTDWSTRTAQTTNDTFGCYIRDINFTVASGNSGCFAGVMWACAQNCGFRNCIITVTSSQAEAMDVGDTVGPGGGHTIENIVTNGGVLAANMSNYFTNIYRGCTFNGKVTNSTRFGSFVSCTFNNPGALGLVNAPYDISTLDDCTFVGTTLHNASNFYHIENTTFNTAQTSPTIASGLCTQYTGLPGYGGTVYYNGSSVSGTSSSLSQNGVVRAGTPLSTIPTTTYPYPSSACVSAEALGIYPTQVSGNTNDVGAAINTALATHNEIFFPIGDYHINTTINLGPGQKLFGGGTNWYVGGFAAGSFGVGYGHTVLSGSANPIINAKGSGPGGTGVAGGSQSVITSMDVCSIGNAGSCIWNGDSNSLIFDSNLSPSSGTSVTLAYGVDIQSGGMLYSNGSVSNQAGPGNASNTGFFIEAHGPTYLINTDCEEFVGTYWTLNGAQNLYICGLDGENGTLCMSITNSSNIYAIGIADDYQGTGQSMISLSGSQVSMWALCNTIFSGEPSIMVTEGGTHYGDNTAPIAYVRFTGIPSPPGTLSTTGYSTPATPGTLTTVHQ